MRQLQFPSYPSSRSSRILPASSRSSGSLVYVPTAIGIAKMHFVSAKAKVDTWITRTLIAPLSEDGRDAYGKKRRYVEK